MPDTRIRGNTIASPSQSIPLAQAYSVHPRIPAIQDLSSKLSDTYSGSFLTRERYLSLAPESSSV